VLTVVVIPVLVGLGVTEFTDFCPWVARRMVRWSAYRRYPDPDRAATKAEELEALIDDRPGRLFKLLTACGFAGAALTCPLTRAISRQADRMKAAETEAIAGSALALEPLPHAEVLAMVYSYIDGEMDDTGYVGIRQHLYECGPCLREYGLEEALRRLVHKSSGDGNMPRSA
jgi:mycothiol system anti-sigma-R factor